MVESVGRESGGNHLPKACEVPCHWAESRRKDERMIGGSVMIDGSCDDAEDRDGVNLCRLAAATHMTQCSVFARSVSVEIPCHPSVDLPISILTCRYDETVVVRRTEYLLRKVMGFVVHTVKTGNPFCVLHILQYDIR